MFSRADRLRLSIVVLIAVVLSLMVVTVKAHAQESAPTVHITQLFPDSSVRAVWDRVVSCSEGSRDTTQTFEQIKFFERDSLPAPRSQVKGEWIAPDSIFITKGYTQDGWVVAHEMLHHALRGPSGPGVDPHPMAIFIKCGLASFQYPTPHAVTNAPVIVVPGSTTVATVSNLYRTTDPLTNRLVRNWR
jgi:hypothetical protein